MRENHGALSLTVLLVVLGITPHKLFVFGPMSQSLLLGEMPPNGEMILNGHEWNSDVTLLSPDRPVLHICRAAT